MTDTVSLRAGAGHHHAISEDRGQAFLTHVEQLAEIGEQIMRHDLPVASTVDLLLMRSQCRGAGRPIGKGGSSSIEMVSSCV